MRTATGRPVSTRALRAALLVALALGVTLAPLGLALAPSLRVRALPARSEPGVPVRWPARVIPWQRPARDEGDRLERRLAALSRELELRPRLDEALLRFDVEGLAEEIRDILARARGRAQVAVHVRDLESQHVLFDQFGDAPLNPASTQKLLTSAAALDFLGSDYVFETRVVASGRTLALVGEGDPTLDEPALAELAARVAGQVQASAFDVLLVDDSAFSPRRFAPGKFDPKGPGYPYQAPSGALSLEFNTVEITVYPLARGRRLGVEVRPASGYVRVDDRGRVGRRASLSVRTYGEGGADGRPARTVVEVRGSLPRGSRPVVLRRRIEHPARFAGSVFARLLAEASASEPLPVRRGLAPADGRVVAVRRSEPLFRVLDRGLAYSNNFIAEQVLRTLAWRMTGDPGDWAEGVSLLRGYWAALGRDAEGVVLENGSGLSDSARVSAAGLVDLISAAHRAHANTPSLLDALPVAGEPGTLRTRLRVSGKRVRAKTGTLDGVSGLSGVITREDGTPQIAFAILTNVAPGERMPARERRALEDRVVLAVLRRLDAYEAQRAGLVPPPTG